MFLRELSKKEKEAFISLSVYVSKSNGFFAEEEKKKMEEYCREMEIPLFEMDNVISLEEIVDVFKNSNLHIKKVVLLESLGLVYADGLYDEKEKNFIKEYAEKIGLTYDIVEEQTTVIKEYLDALTKVYKVV